MAKRIRFAAGIAVIIFLAICAFPAVSQAAPCQEGGITIVPASGTPLALKPGSKYHAVLDFNGKRVDANIQVPACAQPTPASSPEVNGTPSVKAPDSTGVSRTEEPQSQPMWLGLALAALIPIILIALGIWIYVTILGPQRKMKPYRQALEFLRDERYGEALPLLTKVEGQLPDRFRREARFFIALAHYRMGNVPDAEYSLGVLHREDAKDAHVAYLLAHIRVERQLYDEAEPVLEQMEQNQQLGIHHARKLLGLVKFQRGLKALEDGRIDAASDLFEKVKALGDYTEQIPADLRNRHVLLGTRCLFDKDTKTAREQFTSLQSAATQLSGAEQMTLLATAKLGLALADWIEGKKDSYRACEKQLAEAAQMFSPHEPLELQWPDNVGGKDIGKKLAEINERADQPTEKRDLERCLRDLHFLRGMIVLKAWSLMDDKAATDERKAQYEAALVRFACALAHDEDFSDVLMVVGLLKFYLHPPGTATRTEAVDLLEVARKGGMREPDAMEIVNNRKRIEQQHADAVDKYMQILDNYLSNDTVRTEVRQALLKRLSHYKRIQGWGQRPNLTRRSSVEPTVGEICNRSENLRTRVEQILKSQEKSSALDQMRDLSINLQKSGTQLYEQAQAIEQTEAQLLVLTGNQLLRDQ